MPKTPQKGQFLSKGCHHRSRTEEHFPGPREIHGTSPSDFPRARISAQTWKRPGQKESLDSHCVRSQRAAGAESQRLTALAALQNFTRHNPHVRGSISFFIKYIGLFHKLLLLVRLATPSFYELLEFPDHLGKPRKTAELNRNDARATGDSLLCHPGLGTARDSTGGQSQQTQQPDFITCREAHGIFLTRFFLLSTRFWIEIAPNRVPFTSAQNSLGSK